MKNPYENPIQKELHEIRERMFEEAGESLETLVQQLQARQKEPIENRKSLKESKALAVRRPSKTKNRTKSEKA